MSGCRSSQIPEYVQRAFVAAEDKRFYQHHGIDERGLIRAFITNIAEPGRPQGGSTITQQVAKNLLVGDDVSYERKIREMIVASRIDQSLSKDEVLEVYLNSIYLGRGAWGIDMAAHGYFKKPASALTPTEGAMLAAMAKGPAYFSPDRYPERARERYAYVLKRMQEDKVAGAETFNPGVTPFPHILPYERPRREAGFHFVDQLLREAKTKVGMVSLTSQSYTVRSTINAKLQRAAEQSLQDGLARYEASGKRARYEGPELNLGELNMKIETEQSTRALSRGRVVKPVWQISLESARLPLYDVHWPVAVVLRNAGRGQIKVGLRDGRIVPLSVPEHVAAGVAARQRRDLRQRHRGQEAHRRQGRAPHPAQGAGRGAGAGEQDRPHPGDGRQLLVSAEPAQPHQPGAAPARLGDQAADLSRRPAPRPAAQHAWCWTSR